MNHSNVMHYCLLIGSAVLYGAAYIFPHYAWWSVLLFFMPFFYLILRDRVNVFDGFIWSTVAFSLHLSGVLEGLVIVAQGGFFMRILPAALVLVTAIVYGTLWFALSLWLVATLPAYYKNSIWMVSTVLFFLWLEHGCLFMLGVCEGYLLCNPIVPLVQFPALLYYLPILGHMALVALLITTQAAIVYAVVYKHYWAPAILLVTVWLSGVGFWYLHDWHAADCSSITCGTAFFKQHDNITYGGRIIRDYCKVLLEKNPQTEIIFFPESAFRCPILPGEADIVSLFSHEHVGKKISIVTGGFRWDNQSYRNTVYWIEDGVLMDFFDKRHAMALTERAPSEYLLGRVSLITQNYFKEFVGISPHVGKRPVWKLAQNSTIIPYICSELFFNTYPDHDRSVHSDTVLVALCNDNWLGHDYMRWQMVMGARYRAIQWQIPILYVAHFYQALCGPHGQYQPLSVFDHTKQ